MTTTVKEEGKSTLDRRRALVYRLSESTVQWMYLLTESNIRRIFFAIYNISTTK